MCACARARTHVCTVLRKKSEYILMEKKRNKNINIFREAGNIYCIVCAKSRFLTKFWKKLDLAFCFNKEDKAQVLFFHTSLLSKSQSRLFFKNALFKYCMNSLLSWVVEWRQVSRRPMLGRTQINPPAFVKYFYYPQNLSLTPSFPSKYITLLIRNEKAEIVFFASFLLLWIWLVLFTEKNLTWGNSLSTSKENKRGGD